MIPAMAIPAARFVLLAIMIAGLTHCAPPEIAAPTDNDPKPPAEDGIGGTGIASEQPKPGKDDDGIGGTGMSDTHPAPFDDQGIGGTGIVGVITGFGSIIVNGRHVEFSRTTPVSDPLGPLNAASLRVGHVVAVSASARGNALFATRIEIQYQVSGLIETVDPSRGLIRVLGQWIALDTGTYIAEDINDLAIGDSVTVSGLRRPDGIVAATRIDRRSAQAPGLLSATITRLKARQIFASGMVVDRAILRGGRIPAIGDTLTLIGPIRNGRMTAARGRLGARQPFGGRIKRLSISGYPEPLQAGGYTLRGLNIGGIDRRIPDASAVTVDGELVDGGLRARRLTIAAPKSPRRDLIEKGLRRLPSTVPVLPPGRGHGKNETDLVPKILRTEPTSGIRNLPPRPPTQNRRR